MLSYIVGFVAFLLFFLNPLSQLFFPQKGLHRTARPQLNESLIALESPNDDFSHCPDDAFSVHIFSKRPLVLYIENFLSAEEREHLLEISQPLFEPSTVSHDGQSSHRDATVRESEVALIPRTPVVKCIESRARALQGWRSDLWIERLRTQRYVPGGHYSHHFDWSANMGGWGRVSSFMVWADASPDLEGGGTAFPYLLRKSKHPRWCKFVECSSGGNATEMDGHEHEDSVDRQGTVFKPVPGNAVFWENFRPEGSGYEETWHAGLPVVKGAKVGLNIWSLGAID